MAEITTDIDLDDFDFDDPEISAAVERAIRRWVDLVFEESQNRVPRETGYLANSGFVEPGVGDGDQGGVIASIKYDADYAEYVEWGVAGRFEGRRFLSGALDDLEPAFGDILREELEVEFEVSEE